MFKRTKGYLLLTMLVLTGLAGKIHSDTLSGKERRILVKELKTSRTNFLKSIEGLSKKQTDFKPAKGNLSIKDCVYELSNTQHSLWLQAKHSLSEEPGSQKKSVDDEELYSLVGSNPVITVKELKLNNVKEALRLYKNEKAEMLKYANTTTENIRGHFTKTSAGNLDAYQLILLNTLYSEYYVEQIRKIKSHPNFPK